MLRLIRVVSYKRCLHYVQGQTPDPKTREYFYFIDHQGQRSQKQVNSTSFAPSMDLQVQKEKDFLVFFFKRLKVNVDGKYKEEFPYISPCGREHNYIRCDDTPLVFTHIINGTLSVPDRLSYNGAGDRLTLQFEPEKVCMLPSSGRVYHPAPGQYGSIGLIKSSLAIEMSKHFRFETGDETQPPSHFTWNGVTYKLTNKLLNVIKDREISDSG